MIISLLNNTDDKQISKVFINEKKDRYLLIILDIKNKKYLTKVENLFTDKDNKKLVDYLIKNQEYINGYAIFDKFKDVININKYGEINVGFSNNNNEFEYVEKEIDSLNTHFYKTLFTCSLAYKCSNKNFSFEKSEKNIDYPEAFIELKK